MLMRPDQSCLAVVDIQERLAPAMAEDDRVQANTGVLLHAAKSLRVPVLVSEQYPKGLGPTVGSLVAAIPGDAIIEKMTFSCLGERAFSSRWAKLGRPQVVLCGIEAHVCVLQTALDFVAEGIDVFVVADAVSSRTLENKSLGLERMRAAGAHIVSTEMVVFEWLGRAGTPEFKELSALIK